MSAWVDEEGMLNETTGKWENGGKVDARVNERIHRCVGGWN